MGLEEIGIKKFHLVEANNFPFWNHRGFVDINERHGIVMNEHERRPRQLREGEGITWSKVPDAVVYTRIPHFAPVNEPDTWLFNIAKWKAHAMCLTQSVKNEQGLVVSPFVRFCFGWPGVVGVTDFMKPDIHPRAEAVIKGFFERHTKMGYTRYLTARNKQRIEPIVQEIWAHKTLDNQSVLRTGLAMIEGIYGRDGDGFGVGRRLPDEPGHVRQGQVPPGHCRPVPRRSRTRPRASLSHREGARACPTRSTRGRFRFSNG